MPTIQQLVRNGRVALQDKSKSPALAACPQRRGVCTRVITHAGEVLHTTAADQHDGVLLQVVAFPGVRYHLVRGALDSAGVDGRRQRRSKYGAKRPKAGK